jgi:hypothetical protein
MAGGLCKLTLQTDRHHLIMTKHTTYSSYLRTLMMWAELVSATQANLNHQHKKTVLDSVIEKVLGQNGPRI